MNIWLVDTGPLVAYLDSSETEHHHIGDIIDGFTGVLATTALDRRGFNTYRLGDRLMQRYADTPPLRRHPLQPPRNRQQLRPPARRCTATATTTAGVDERCL